MSEFVSFSYDIFTCFPLTPYSTGSGLEVVARTWHTTRPWAREAHSPRHPVKCVLDRSAVHDAGEQLLVRRTVCVSKLLANSKPWQGRWSCEYLAPAHRTNGAEDIIWMALDLVELCLIFKTTEEYGGFPTCLWATEVRAAGADRQDDQFARPLGEDQSRQRGGLEWQRPRRELL